MDMVYTFLVNLWHLTIELAPWLLFGLLLAGLLHVLLPEGFIRRHLGGRGFGNVFKAVSIGVPMPLCSCGVIPTALGLKRDGASDGAAVGFLISTPQTGVDSILVCAGFLGWPLALFKVLSALLSGLVGGMLVNVAVATRAQPAEKDKPHDCCHTKAADSTAASKTASPPPAPSNQRRRWGQPGVHEVLTFAFGRLFHDIYRWLIIGVVIAAVITTLVPPGYLAEVGWIHGVAGLLLVLVVSIPMYICSTASVPLAAALVQAGFSPGAALVLLMVGPVTNVATIGVTYRAFGRRALVVYLGTVIGMSLAAGVAFDWLLAGVGGPGSGMLHLPGWLSVAAALLLTALVAYWALLDLRRRFRRGRPAEVPCPHESDAANNHRP